MTTEDLIRALVIDRYVGPRLNRGLQVALLCGISLVALLFFTLIGFREDIIPALATVRFLFKFVVVVPLALIATYAMVQSASPVFAFGRWRRGLATPAAFLVIGLFAELIAVPSSEWETKLIGSNSVNCMSLIPALGIWPLIMMIAALKRGAPANPGISGALAGLASSGIAATFYAMNCFDDSPLFVITWYPLAASILVLIGNFIGLRHLRW